MLPYDPHEIEDRWRHRWEEAGLYTVDTGGPYFYNLVEFPYPSAEGLHVGHFFKYTGVDALGRYQRMRGRPVFQPIGFDSFGIHSENFALRLGEHPATLTARTTTAFRAQLRRGGMGWDWSRTIDTSDPRYYRWTQWILTRLFDAGLMYQAEAPVIWCPSCLTVLAREQTEGGRCERCDSEVTERHMRQWFLAITLYAERLLDGLGALDWPERAKRLQRQWIGRSTGREIDFGDLAVFTTRPETLPAATFLAVPPGHRAAGGTRPHPLTGEPVPVMEAGYAIESYGTGVVMGVPSHDERDRCFAAVHRLPISDAGLLAPAQVAVVGRPAVRYRLRDWLISRQRYWGPPIPIIHCPACGPRPVPEEQLPVLLPPVTDYRPTGTGLSPLAMDRQFAEAHCPDCGKRARRETDVSDTFVDSSWYFLRYPSPELDERPWDPERCRPVDFYAGGPEHVQRHHLYARFMTMALFDLGLVPFEEPFPHVRLGGLLGSGGTKMSKSRGNVVSPDPYVAAHGADALRCGLLFACPWEASGEFHDDTIAGIERFFSRLWHAVLKPPCGGEPDPRMETLIGDVTNAIERLHFNVALARLMEATAAVTTPRAARVVVRLLAPLAPHLAEELWARLGEPFSVHSAPWPVPDHRVIESGSVTIVVQVNGRVRRRIQVPRATSESEIVAAAREAVAVDRPAQVFYVPGRLVNFVCDV